MMNYLTTVWNLSITHAAGIVNIFGGITHAFGIVFAFFVDAFLGDFYMLVLSSIANTIVSDCISFYNVKTRSINETEYEFIMQGLGLLSLSTPTFFGPCSDYEEECIGHIQKVLFVSALPLLVVGTAGHVVSLLSFLEQQTTLACASAENQDKAEAEVKAPVLAELELEHKAQAPALAESQTLAEPEPEPERKAESEAPAPTDAKVAFEHKAQAELLFAHIPGLIMVMVVIIVGGILLPYIKSWSVRFGIAAICALTATGVFLSGSPEYKKDVTPEGSPLTIALRVVVASVTKDFQQVTNFEQTYNNDNAPRTRSLRWLDKAATKFPDQAMSKSWTLCTVREVEDTKASIRTVPMLLTLVGSGLVSSLANTYFLEQASHMDTKLLGSIKIQLPIFLIVHNMSASASYIYALPMKCISRKYFAPTGIGIGMVLSVLCCVTAAIVEAQRLRVIRNHGSMSVLFLLPQFVLVGAADGITNGGIQRFLRDQVPESMYGVQFYFRNFVLGLGSMAGVLSVYVVGMVSDWFQHTLNKSRLDLYYWTLAGLSLINLVIYAIVASYYNYNESPLDKGCV
ncbi:putative proton-dependent oligopeptide transporter family, MFS transporter superfamily [Helianthus annuus]|nr:putative proton-dependent oligopeptide transporter family, MFS transporter superfamily [Helianthus annuus]